MVPVGAGRSFGSKEMAGLGSAEHSLGLGPNADSDRQGTVSDVGPASGVVCMGADQQCGGCRRIVDRVPGCPCDVSAPLAPTMGFTVGGNGEIRERIGGSSPWNAADPPAQHRSDRVDRILERILG